MAILLVIGVMDLRVMAVVAAAIIVERLAPAGERVARAINQRRHENNHEHSSLL